VDQNCDFLNQIAANSAKVEALHITITSILKEMCDNRSIAEVAIWTGSTALGSVINPH
jgi:hypothetical protein